MPPGIPEGPRRRLPAQVKVRADGGCQMAEVKALPGCQGPGGGQGCWVEDECQMAQVGSEVEVR